MRERRGGTGKPLKVAETALTPAPPPSLALEEGDVPVIDGHMCSEFRRNFTVDYVPCTESHLAPRKESRSPLGPQYFLSESTAEQDSQ
jgi:hypothetical protein